MIPLCRPSGTGLTDRSWPDRQSADFAHWPQTPAEPAQPLSPLPDWWVELTCTCTSCMCTVHKHKVQCMRWISIKHGKLMHGPSPECKLRSSCTAHRWKGFSQKRLIFDICEFYTCIIHCICTCTCTFYCHCTCLCRQPTLFPPQAPPQVCGGALQPHQPNHLPSRQQETHQQWEEGHPSFTHPLPSILPLSQFPHILPVPSAQSHIHTSTKCPPHQWQLPWTPLWCHCHL